VQCRQARLHSIYILKAKCVSATLEGSI